MDIEQLTEHQALNPGAELWCLSHPADSSWSRRIDWLNNYTLLKTIKSSRRPIAERLSQILDLTGLPRKNFTRNTPLILVIPNQNLPAKYLLMATQPAQAPEQRSQELHQIWLGLNRPRIRIFTPFLEANHLQASPWSGEPGAFQVVST